MQYLLINIFNLLIYSALEVIKLTKDEEKAAAKQRRADLYAEYLVSGKKNYRQFALMKGDLTVVRYWQMLSKAAKELAS